jgi:large subunit ribosomal protein L22
VAEPKDKGPKPGGKSEADKAKKQAAAAKKPTARKPAAKKPAAKKPVAAPAKVEPAKDATPPVVRASAQYVRVSPRKARLLADQVRGMPIEDARSLLDFSGRGVARDIRRLIDSAAANAENNHDLPPDELRITEIQVDEGPTIRRWRARARGRATRIEKRTSHVSVALTPEES